MVSLKEKHFVVAFFFNKFKKINKKNVRFLNFSNFFNIKKN